MNYISSHYIGNYELTQFVKAELKELNSRDFDTLYGCIQDNLSDMSVLITDELNERLENILENELKFLNK